MCRNSHPDADLFLRRPLFREGDSKYRLYRVSIPPFPMISCSCVRPLPQVEFRVGDDAPTRPVEEKKWLKPTGPLPLAYNYDSNRELNYDIRSAELGGCDSPSHFEGCQAYYVKVPMFTTRLL